MIEVEQHARIQRGSERNFGLVFFGVLAIVGLWPLLSGEAPRWWAVALAVAFLAAALLRPAWLRPLNEGWFAFGLLLGRFVAPLVMAALFFLVVTPTGLVMRALGKDLLRLRIDRGASTYWITRGPEQPMGSMRNQF